MSRLGTGRSGRWLVGGVALVTLMACTNSSNSTASNSTGPLVIAMFAPFSGPSAEFGQHAVAGCLTAAKVINDSGGVMGHTIQCRAIDTRGDPADAIPAADQMLATIPNLVAVLGPTSTEASATVPLINQAHIPMFASTGQAEFDKNPYPYYHRLLPADDYAGYAMALWAQQKGYTRAVAVFGNDIGSQGTVPSLQKGFSKLGGTIVVNQSIALDQSSYRSEVENVIAANPQVIFTETDPQTATTYFSELKQLHGSLLPIIGADPTFDPNYWKPVSAAVGAQNLINSFVAEQPSVDSSGPAYDIYNQALLADGAQIPNPSQWSHQPGAEHYFDSVIITALAIVQSKSTKGSDINAAIPKVVSAASGATQVISFKDGEAALQSGKTIDYVGPGGPTRFDQYGNSSGGFEVDRYDTSGNAVKVGQISSEEVANLLSS